MNRDRTMNQSTQPDILIYLSDQHDGRVMGCAGHPVVETPNLDALASEGTMFENAYTSCPLCVPARMSFLTGRLPVHTGVYTNRGSIPSEMPTFLHLLALAGYETVLCGRMHFEGEDQRHGFTKRIAGDITPTSIGPMAPYWERMGPMAPVMTEGGCIHSVGGGNSPVQEYDRYVIREAETYLSQPHTKPQCVVVGTYAPHFPYIAPTELYDKYRMRTDLPPTLDIMASAQDAGRLRDTTPELVKGVRAAYWGLIEFEDHCLGLVKSAWDTYLSRHGKRGIFFYLSDHGDHAGDRGFYGKQSLYEAAVRIPMIVSGDGILAGNRLRSPVSLLDAAPTVCQLAGARELPFQDGVSLIPELERGEEREDRAVTAEWINLPYGRGTDYGRMIRQGKWKLISYVSHPEEELLICPDSDPWELYNRIAEFPEAADELREAAFHNVCAGRIVEEKNIREDGYQIVAQFQGQKSWVSSETWIPPRSVTQLPKQYLSTNQPMPEKFRRYWEMKNAEEGGKEREKAAEHSHL